MSSIRGLLRRPLPILATLAALFAFAGCASELSDATAVTVSVMRDPALSLSRISYLVFATDRDATRDVPISTFVSEGPLLDRPFVVEKRDADVFLLVVQGFTADDPRVPKVEQRVRAQFVHEKTVALRVYLSADCVGMRCDASAGLTCYGLAQGAVAAGSCGPTPGPYPLDVISEPGQEAAWVVPAPVRDTGADAGADTGLDTGLVTAPDATLVDASADAAAEASVGDGGERCVVPMGATCDPVSNCRCSGGTHCQLRSSQLVCVPVPTPAVPRGQPCESGAACAEGLTCALGVCTPYCREDTDCGTNSTCILNKEGGYGVCYAHCGAPTNLSCEPGASCTTLRFEKRQGGFCTVPYSPCPSAYLADGTCNEVGPHGNGVCASGTDTEDCCNPSPSRATCDITGDQCGCSRQQTCQVTALQGISPTFGCAAFGAVGLGGTCTADLDCGRGLGCVDGMCSRFCANDAQCGAGGWCTPLVNEGGAVITGLKVCMHTCNFATQAPCAAATNVCASFPGTTVSYCIVTPTGCAPAYMNNGVCDVPSRRCAAGTDVNDCALSTP